MDFAKWNQERYERDQKDLQKFLEKENCCLGDKLVLLYKQQMHIGFVRDDLSGVQRSWAINPEDTGNSFLIQYNPKRSKRGKGAGRATVPEGVLPINNGCFLCKENIAWQQMGLEMGYSFKINDNTYLAWCNPFPLMPNHVTIASEIHEPQGWILGEKKKNFAKIRRIVNDLLKIISQTPDFVAFYNGLKAGATIPSHLHYQFFKRQAGHAPFPLEKAAFRLSSAGHKIPFIVHNYPITCAYFNGCRENILDQIVNCMCDWTEACGHAPTLSANIIATLDKPANGDEEKNTYNLYFIPRDTYFSISPGRKGVVGGLEVFGEIAFSDSGEFERLQEGLITYDYVARILKAVESQMVHEFIEKTKYSL